MGNCDKVVLAFSTFSGKVSGKAWVPDADVFGSVE